MAPPNLSYPLIIEDYKNHPRSFPVRYLSFQSLNPTMSVLKVSVNGCVVVALISAYHTMKSC